MSAWFRSDTPPNSAGSALVTTGGLNTGYSFPTIYLPSSGTFVTPPFEVNGAVASASGDGPKIDGGVFIYDVSTNDFGGGFPNRSTAFGFRTPVPTALDLTGAHILSGVNVYDGANNELGSINPSSTAGGGTLFVAGYAGIAVVLEAVNADVVLSISASQSHAN